MNRLALTIAATLIVLVLAPAPARAIPAFARKYGTNCTMCHSSFPRLNDFGARFRQNGYQVPGRESEEQTVIDGPAPVALRSSAGFNLDRVRNVPLGEDLAQLQVNGLDLLSGGLLTAGVGYFVIVPPPIPAVPGLAEQEGTVEMANVILVARNLPWLTLRVGRFEPAYAVFSAKRQLTVAPYELYEFGFPGGARVSDTQTGLELAGHGGGFAYAAGWVTGGGNDPLELAPVNFYLRVSKTFGAGEGQTAGQRVGLVGRFGQSRPDASLPSASRQSFWQAGADASLNLWHFNLSVQAAAAIDRAALWGVAEQVVSWGGFAELSYLPRTDFVVFTRLDGLRTPTMTTLPTLEQGDTLRWTGGARYYLFDNAALHLEVSHRQQKARQEGSETRTDDFVTLRLDFAA